MALSSNARSARRTFTNLYGQDARDVVSRIASGWSTQRISGSTGLPETTVAAYRANVTRGTYLPFVDGSTAAGFVGSCQF
jgi:FixJ family two-component response regulator